MDGCLDRSQAQQGSEESVRAVRSRPFRLNVVRVLKITDVYLKEYDPQRCMILTVTLEKYMSGTVEGRLKVHAPKTDRKKHESLKVRQYPKTNGVCTSDTVQMQQAAMIVTDK